MSASNIFLYIVTVMIWGSTWFPIKLSLGEVSPEVSVIYRLAIAAVILFLWCWFRRLPMRFTARQHMFIAILGLFLYGFDLTLLYEGSAYIPSGLVAIIFSTIILFNMLNGYLFMSRVPAVSSLLGAGVGIVGLCTAFWPELSSFSLSSETAIGLLIVLGAALTGSLGNMASIRNQKDGVPVTQANALAMTYGVCFLIVYALISGSKFTFDPNPVYVSSLFYLAVFGSVLAFGFYLTLLNRIGPERAAYANLLYPLIALLVSSAFEGYEWTPRMMAAIALMLTGNFLVLMQFRSATNGAAISWPFAKAILARFGRRS